MPRVPIVDSLKTPLGLFRQIHREEYSKYSPSDFLVTDLDLRLDGLEINIVSGCHNSLKKLSWQDNI